MRKIEPLGGASPLAIHGPWAAFLTRTGITLQSLDSGERRFTPIPRACGLGVLGDGAFVVVSNDGPAAYRIPTAGAPERHEGMVSLRPGGRARVLALSEPGSFVCSIPDDDAWHHRFAAEGRLELLGCIEIGVNGHGTVAAGDGASITYAPAGEIVRRWVDGRESRHPLPETWARHLAPGPRPDLVWVTTSEHELLLVELATPALVRARFPLDGTPVSLAASGSRAAVVVGRDDAPDPFSVAVFDGERPCWRAPIGERDPLQEVYVASSTSHVVVLGTELEAWTIDSKAVTVVHG